MAITSAARRALLPASRRITKTAPSFASTISSTRYHLASSPPWQTTRAFSCKSSHFVKKYTPEHEWVELDEDGKTATIGITEYAAKALGDVVYVELPEVGLAVAKGDSIGAVESVKSASDIYAPLSGTVVESNPVLEEKPGTINKQPEEGDGWLAKMELEDAGELDALMSKEDYDAMEK